MSDEPPVPGLEPAFDAVVKLGPMEDLGSTRAGHRRIVPIIGGRITGAFDGEILPGGADWQVLRADGAIDVDGRYTARAATGELLFIRATGVRSGDPATLAALLSGHRIDPRAYYFRTALRLECATRPDLESSVYVASYVRAADEVRYIAYRVT